MAHRLCMSPAWVPLSDLILLHVLLAHNVPATLAFSVPQIYQAGVHPVALVLTVPSAWNVLSMCGRQNFDPITFILYVTLVVVQQYMAKGNIQCNYAS